MSGLITVNDAANYFLSLYVKTDYTYDRRKMQKLIIFADLLYYATYDKRLLRDTDVTATERGLSIDNLSELYDLSFNFKNERGLINEACIADDAVLELSPVYGFDAFSVDNAVRLLLRYTFCQFGAYSGDDLTYMSRKSALWQLARNRETSTEYYVTEAIYRQFLCTTFQMSQSIDERRDAIVTYLKGLLSSD